MNDSNNELLKYCWPSDNSIANLQNGVIYCQHYSCYNDPFEFWNHVHDGIPDHQKEPERFAAALEAWGMGGSSPQDEDVIAYFDECQSYQPPFAVMRDGVRIACFGSQRDNLLMWSHYADGLRGFCIVFDEKSVAEAEPSGHLIDVKYVDAPPTVDSFVYAIAQDQNRYHQVAIEETETRIRYLGKTDEQRWIAEYEQAGAEAVETMRQIWQQVFAVKPSDWSYERERRLLVQTDQIDAKPIQRPYPPDAIKEVILGEQMSEAFRQLIVATLEEKHPNAKIRTARRAQGSYTIDID